MVNLKLFRDVFLILISLILIALAINYGYEKFKKKGCISEQNLDKIREEKQKEIDKKQREIDSILFDMKFNVQKIDSLNEKIKFIDKRNNDLQKELEKRKSEIKKMSNDEIVDYWKNEFKK